ncbi:MAG: CCA tRNA nucleotidyltransferase [Ruminococcaceae bacterium]|nr:CCA tRNA nucleotidyltransferase [Oscillospiraceae bacterium]
MTYPENVRVIIDKLEESGESAYIVGGSLRDMLLGIAPHDYDVTTSALPEKTLSVFSDMRVIETGIKHGTVTVISGGEPIEVTTFRVDGEYTDSRRPDSVSFTSSIEEDLARRDFTVNAMAYSQSRGLIDPFGGAADVKRGIIRAVGEPRERFGEDALRIMRAFRFSAQLGFEIEKRTLEGAVECAAGLGKIARERIGAEFIKLLTSPHSEKALALMVETGVIKYAVGECAISDNLIRIIPEMQATDAARLGALLCRNDADVARDVLHGLRCSTKQTRGALAVALGAHISVRSAEDARRLIARTGIYAPYAARLSEKLGVSDAGAEQLTVKQQNTPCTVQQLAINGKVLAGLGARGKSIGKTLELLLDAVIENPELNEEDSLVILAKKILNEMKDGENV